MNNQRIRNLTTLKMHTGIGDIYEDLGFIIGDNGIMTHMLPRVCSAITPWLKEQITDPRFWNGEYDPTHEGDTPLRAMTPEESAAALELYAAMPNPLAGKKVMAVMT